jgi:PAS domain S-box-containing protein
MVWTNRADGSVDYVNEKWTQFTGLSFEETQNGGWGKAIHPDDAAETFRRWTEAAAKHAPFEVEYRIRRGEDGSYRWHLARNLPLLDSDGNVLKWFGTATDIDDQKRAQETIQRSQEELERAVAERTLELSRSNAELEQFAYVASHDLQEPLRMVASYTQLLAERYRGRLDSDADEFIGYAVDGAVRMQALINDLLTYSRAGATAEPHGEVDCDLVLTRTLENLRGAIQESAAKIETSALPTVWGDAMQLGQVFQNLIGNAIKFRGPEPPMVRVSATDAGDAWLFRIRDNGIGIDPKYSDRIFALFQRLHSRDEFPGTGIGLALCKKIVEQHGGELGFESTPGNGSTFYFTIPKPGYNATE